VKSLSERIWYLHIFLERPGRRFQARGRLTRRRGIAAPDKQVCLRWTACLCVVSEDYVALYTLGPSQECYVIHVSLMWAGGRGGAYAGRNWQRSVIGRHGCSYTSYNHI